MRWQGWFAALLLATNLHSAEPDALAIEDTLLQRHLPFGTVLDPIFASSDSDDEIVGYTRCGDSATWTGHYLAAEAYRFAVTRRQDSLDAVHTALAGIRSLLDVTGTDLLARCYVDPDSPYAAGILQEEEHNGIHTGILNDRQVMWVGNTSRDQYSGVFYGLGVAYELVDDPDTRRDIRILTTRALDYLRSHDWIVRMPDGDISTTFWGRADQQLAFLQVGRHINPDRFSTIYSTMSISLAAEMLVPLALETDDQHNSYFKFNLDTINLYSLLRSGDNSYLKWIYGEAYGKIRGVTRNHYNAFFNMIDRALDGPNAGRDAATSFFLDVWLWRPRRDFYVDLRGQYTSCSQEDRACQPIPIEARVRTDFLWQRSPFLLYGGGSGLIETAGIDYLLPYWMARYYSVVSE